MKNIKMTSKEDNLWAKLQELALDDDFCGMYADCAMSALNIYEERIAVKNAKLIKKIIDNFLGPEPPVHILRPQVQKLVCLSKYQLWVLSKVNFPVSSFKAAVVGCLIGSASVIKNLVRRGKIARIIRQNQDKGLYDISEHQMGEDL